MDPDEQELVRDCLRGDQDACTRLVDTYASMVGTVIWRATGRQDVVEDLAQETFLRVFRGLRYFDGRAKFSTWVYTIAHRVAIDHRRQITRLPTANVEEGVERIDRLEAPVRDPEELTSRRELDRIVRDQLDRLPDKYRLPLVYVTDDGLDYATVASMLGVKPGTVKTLMFRGRELLKSRVQAELERAAGGRSDVIRSSK